MRVHVRYAALKLYAFLKFSLVETLLVATKWITWLQLKAFSGGVQGGKKGRKGEELGNEAYAMCSESMDNCVDQVYAYDVSFER